MFANLASVLAASDATMSVELPQVDHRAGELRQIRIANAQLTCNCNNLCDVIRRGCNLSRHALDLIGKGGEFFFGAIDCLAYRRKS